jgi:hypothetical protein
MLLKTSWFIISAFLQLSGFDTSHCTLVNIFCRYLQSGYPVILPHIKNYHAEKAQAAKFKKSLTCHFITIQVILIKA